MALKPRYLIDGTGWLPIARAAKLIGTNSAGIKKLMGEGALEWHQVPRGSALLVEEAGVLRLRAERNIGEREAAARGRAVLKTAVQSGRSQLSMKTDASVDRRHFGIFVPTWDPAPYVAPVPGRPPSDTDGETG